MPEIGAGSGHPHGLTGLPGRRSAHTRDRWLPCSQSRAKPGRAIAEGAVAAPEGLVVWGTAHKGLMFWTACDWLLRWAR